MMDENSIFPEPCNSCKNLAWTVDARWNPATGVILQTFTNHCEHASEATDIKCDHYQPQEKHAAANQ